jgi:hypothetical protein
MSRRTILQGLAAALGSLAVQASAHRIDEILQATLVSIEPPRVELRLRLNPGADLAGIFLRMVDGDGNGELSAGETRAYAELVRRSLDVELDGRPLVLGVEAVEATDPEKLRSGTGAFVVELAAETGPMGGGSHCLAFANRHLPELSAFLVNAVVPRTPGIEIGRQERDDLQRQARIHFVVAGDPSGIVRDRKGPPAVGTAAAVLAFLCAAGWRWRGRGGHGAAAGARPDQSRRTWQV